MNAIIDYFLFLDVDKLHNFFQVLFTWPFVTLILVGYFLKSYHLTIETILQNINLKYKDICINIATPPVQKTDQKTEESTVLSEIESPKNSTFSPQITVETFVELVKNKPKAVFDEVSEAFVQLGYERIFNSIFGTQIHLLDYLFNNGLAPEANLSPYFNRFLLLTNNQGNKDINIYLNFLYSQYLIEKTNSGNVQLTQYGVNFMNYLKKRYPTYYNIRSW